MLNAYSLQLDAITLKANSTGENQGFTLKTHINEMSTNIGRFFPVIHPERRNLTCKEAHFEFGGLSWRSGIFQFMGLFVGFVFEVQPESYLIKNRRSVAEDATNIHGSDEILPTGITRRNGVVGEGQAISL
jgi:hypothetical protein